MKRALVCIALLATLISCRPALDQKNAEVSKLEQRDKIAKMLPHGLRLSDRIPRLLVAGRDEGDQNSNAKTVEATLIEMGAHLDNNGKLVDAAGWAIEFRRRVIPGTPITDKTDPDVRRQREDSEKKIRVINYEVDWHK
jgi:hypothetical protein